MRSKAILTPSAENLLKGKVALITGASRGLGKALGEVSVQAGALIAICARNADALNEVAVALESKGADVLAVAADVSDRRDVERLVATTLLKFDHIDILVNNASYLGPSPMPYLIDMPTDAYELVLRTNVLAPFMVTKSVLPSMIQRRQGSIINVISDAGLTAYEGWGAYGASKAALEMMTRIWAAELKGTGVRVNSVDPGEMDTEMHRLAMPEENPADYPKPEAVVDVFLYLASDRSRNITGQLLRAEDFMKRKK